MPTINISVNLLRAAQHIAAKDDTRYYLNGVLLDITPEGVCYAATNGHCLIALRDTDSGAPARKIIVPHETINALTPGKKKVPLTYSDDAQECRIGDVMFKPIEGKFPDYRKVIPESATKEWAQFQVKYLVAFQEAADKAYDSPHVEVWPNGPDGTALVTAGRKDFAGALMPTRAQGDPSVALWAVDRESIAA